MATKKFEMKRKKELCKIYNNVPKSCLLPALTLVLLASLLKESCIHIYLFTIGVSTFTEQCGLV